MTQETKMQFVEFKKMARLRREVVITEKLDGTNAQVNIRPADGTFEFGYDVQIDDMYIRAGSRTRWIGVGNDNFAFAKYVYDTRRQDADEPPRRLRSRGARALQKYAPMRIRACSP